MEDVVLDHSTPDAKIPTFWAGPMFGGKSSKMILQAREYYHANKVIVAFSPSKDTRSSSNTLAAHNELRHVSVTCDHPYDMLEKLPEKCQAVFIDETHMWVDFKELGEDSIYEVWNRVMDAFEKRNIEVFLAGLDRSFKNEFFESFLTLWRRCNVIHCHSRCGKPDCGQYAYYNIKVDGSVDGKAVEAGGADKYISVCRFHFLQTGIK